MKQRILSCRWPARTATALGLVVVLFATGCSPTDAPAAIDEPGTSDVPEVSIPPLEAPADDSATGSGPSRSEAPEGAPTEAAVSEESAEAAQSAPEGAIAKPGDMLTADETRAAEDLALESASGMLAAATDRDALGAAADLGALADQATYRVMYSQRYATKADEPRSAEVAFYRYDTNEVVLSKVNLKDETVTQLAVPPGYMAPLLPEEVQEAARVARADTTVTDYLKSIGMDPASTVANGLLTTSTEDDTATCSETRCVRLFFFDADHVVPTFTVVVDLATVEVIEIAPMFPPTVEEEATP